MAEAVKHLWTLSQDESIQEILMMKERAKKDQMAREEYVREESREEGREEGREEERQNIILNMLRNKIDTSMIAKVTGVSEAKILQLQNQKPHSSNNN